MSAKLHKVSDSCKSAIKISTSSKNKLVSDASSHVLLNGKKWSVPYSNTVHRTCKNSVKNKRNYVVNGFSICDIYTEGIDYFQVFGNLSEKWPENDVSEGVFGEFKIIELSKRTRVFSKTYLVEDKRTGKKVCEINCVPYEDSVIPGKSCNIKFDNEILYYKYFDKLYVELLFNDVGIEFKSVTRLDIYRDFQKFLKFVPEVLIERFVKEKYLNCSRAKSYVVNKIGEKVLYWKGLTIGSYNSGREVQLYNKSEELSVKGNKEYIRRVWDEVGFHKKVDCWRLEFRLIELSKNSFEETGIEKITIELNDVFDKKKLHSVYESGLNQLFRFVKNEHKQKCRCENVELFSERDYSVKLLKKVYHVDKLWWHKMTVRGLMRDVLSDYENREHETRSKENQIDSINKYVYDYHLVAWFKDDLLVRMAKKYKVQYYDNLAKFVYGYYGQRGGLL